ncbi:MAG: hypothetical protein SPG10_13745 [Enterocloster clostridioformis]|nr:hypothetical protein [Enterocloster clostridioformis]
MSRIAEEKRICDRCKKELSLYPSFKIMQGKPNKIQALATRHSWGDGYPIDSIKELCPDCKKAFDAFMAGARWNVIELYEFLARLKPRVYVRVFFDGEEIMGGCVDEITDLKGYQHHNVMSIQQNLANTTIIEID